MLTGSRIAVLFALFGLAGNFSHAGETVNQKGVRARREAMTKAINAHNFKTVKTFIDPSFKWHDKTGNKMTYEQTLQGIEQIFKQRPDITQVDKIEKIEVKGTKAEVTISRLNTYTDPMGKKQEEKYRVVETWKKINSRWMAVAESVL
jgi:ketosteroid isomerase-like protein